MTPLLHVVAHPAYLLACALAGLLGRRRRGGFFGFALIALVLTPLGALLILYVGAERPTPPDRRA